MLKTKISPRWKIHDPQGTRFIQCDDTSWIIDGKLVDRDTGIVIDACCLVAGSRICAIKRVWSIFWDLGIQCPSDDFNRIVTYVRKHYYWENSSSHIFTAPPWEDA